MKTKSLTARYIRSLLPPRERCSHKGDYGHVLVLAGSKGMTGAAALCVSGALRVGSGLVSAGIPAGEQPVAASLFRPEAMTISLPGTSAGSLSVRAIPGILEIIAERKITAVITGPGLGNHPETAQFVRKLLASVNLPLVLDAGAINSLIGEAGGGYLRVRSLIETSARVVVTPHPGEFGRLLNMPVKSVTENREKLAHQFALENNVVCVLKGYHTVIAGEGKVFINPTGNPGMATGGAGDVLAGMIGGLTGQVVESSVLYAALAGTYLHGLAGDCAAVSMTEMAMLAGDIVEAIPAAIKALGS